MKQLVTLCLLMINFAAYAKNPPGYFSHTGAITNEFEMTFHSPYYRLNNKNKHWLLTDSMAAMDAFCHEMAKGYYLNHSSYNIGYLTGISTDSPELQDSRTIVDYITCSRNNR